VVERFGGDKVADKCDRFSVYIFGRATKDEDVLKVGYVLECAREVGTIHGTEDRDCGRCGFLDTEPCTCKGR
jgi:hypothetical protein